MIGRPAALAALVVGLSGSGSQPPSPVGIYIHEASVGTASDYALAIDGQPVPILNLNRGSQPLSAIVLQDVSGSMYTRPVMATARRLVGVARAGDAIRLGTFADKILLGTTPVTDRVSADRAAREVDQPKGASPLWEAVAEGIDALQSADGMRIVVVFSDGMATANDRGFDDTDDLAVRSGVLICVAGVADSALDIHSQMRVIGRNEGLQRLARDTGGDYRELHKPDDDPIHLMVAMLNDMRERTRLEFVPPVRDGAPHSIEVTRSGRGVTARARMAF